MKEIYIRFLAPVIPPTVEQLFKIVDKALKDHATKIHLLISSPGGAVLHGISLYNFLKSLPIDVQTYNFGSVDSIGVVMFCAGMKRYCMPNARFLIHPVQFNTQGSVQYDEKKIAEILDGLRIDQTNIVGIISNTIGISVDELYTAMAERRTLNPQEAKEIGLVHEVNMLQIPRGTTIYSIGETGTQMINPAAQFPPQVPR